MFSSLERSVIDQLNARCVWRRVPAKEWVIDYQGRRHRRVLRRCRRGAGVDLLQSGREVILADIEGGGFFGELAPIDGQPRSAGVLALSDALVATMPGAVFMVRVEIRTPTLNDVTKLLAARVRALEIESLNIRPCMYGSALPTSCCGLRSAIRRTPVAEFSRRGQLTPRLPRALVRIARRSRGK